MYQEIKYWILDVDGTMTDGSVYYDEFGNEMKKFNTKDAVGFFAIRAMGMKTIVLTGRECKATERRMKELKVDYLFQNIKDKENFLQDFFAKNFIRQEEIAYIGDDLNDYRAMKLAGFVACPKDASPEVQRIANYISQKKGGYGAIRDIVCHVLEKRGEWEKAVRIVY